jgi:hypothetical protein
MREENVSGARKLPQPPVKLPVELEPWEWAEIIESFAESMKNNPKAFGERSCAALDKLSLAIEKSSIEAMIKKN